MRRPRPYTRALSPRNELIYRIAHRICARVYAGNSHSGQVLKNEMSNGCTCREGQVCDAMRMAAEDVLSEILKD